jgi:hypothetical protein
VCPPQTNTHQGGINHLKPDTSTECEGEFDEPQCLVACPAGDACIVPLAA